MGRLSEYKVMLGRSTLPSDDSFLMQAPSLGLSDKKIIIKIRANQRKLKTLAKRENDKLT